MTTDSECVIIVESDAVVRTLQEDAVERLAQSGGELLLGFRAVRRIDDGIARALEHLAGLAKESSVKVTLCDVAIDVYRVLKLLKLAKRFSFTCITGME